MLRGIAVTESASASVVPSDCMAYDGVDGDRASRPVPLTFLYVMKAWSMLRLLEVEVIHDGVADIYRQGETKGLHRVVDREATSHAARLQNGAVKLNRVGTVKAKPP